MLKHLYSEEINTAQINVTNKKQEVLERTNLPAFFTLFKNVICIKNQRLPQHNLSG
jgi:hypothetical protein